MCCSADMAIAAAAAFHKASDFTCTRPLPNNSMLSNLACSDLPAVGPVTGRIVSPNFPLSAGQTISTITNPDYCF